MESLRDREVVCSASDHQSSNFESCVWVAVSSHSFHHPQQDVLAQFSLNVHKGGLKPYPFHFILSLDLSHHLQGVLLAQLSLHVHTGGQNPFLHLVSKHQALRIHTILNQCWLNVGPLSATSAQHLAYTGFMCRICWDVVGSMLYQCLQRWLNIEPTVDSFLV